MVHSGTHPHAMGHSTSIMLCTVGSSHNPSPAQCPHRFDALSQCVSNVYRMRGVGVCIECAVWVERLERMRTYCAVRNAKREIV